MGHKVNPDIFRLGVSKTWSFQLKSNKNFIKNLFLFKFLRNLFMNYTIPFFNFKKRRNQKFNDKLIMRGEEQIVSSPFVKNNILFSHVYFGLIKDRLFIESFFIDVAFKQTKKKNETVKRSQFLDVAEYKPWNPLFYKTSIIGRLTRSKKKKNKIKSYNKLRKLFANRVFKFVGKKSKIFKVKSLKRMSKDFYFFLRSFNPKYSGKLVKFLRPNYKIFIKKVKQKTKIKARKHFFIKIFKVKKRKKYRYNGIMDFNYFVDYFSRKKFFNLRKKKFFSSYTYFKKIFFRRQKEYRFVKRITNRLNLRFLRKSKRFNYVKFKFKYKNLNKDYLKITLPKLLRLLSKSVFSSKEAVSLKRNLPKNPVYLYDIAISDEKTYVFYKNYNNIKILKYFIRLFKFINFFPLKKKIFFSQNLISLLMNFFGLVNSSVLSKKIYLLLQSLMFYTLSFSFFNFIHFKKKFFSKFVFFKGVSKTIYRSIIELTDNKKLNFSIVGQNKFRFNSSLVLNYILIKLGQYFTIHEIVNPLSFYIKSLTSIAGYKILITGRLTRKERAAVMIRSGKRMPLSTIKANIDYSAGFKIMKFGLVGIKVYLLLNSSNLLNLYKFQYNYN